MPPENQTNDVDGEVERLSQELKHQVREAKDRITDRYGKLIETRSFKTPPDGES